MSTLFIIFFSLSICHYLYDGLISPYYRFKLRFELFELRDKLRNLKIEKNGAFDTKIFEILDDSINSNINFMSQLYFHSIIKINRYLKSHPDVESLINKRVLLLKECDLAEVQEIRDSMSKITIKVMLVNSGAFLPYIIPPLFPLILIVMILDFIFKLIRLCKSWSIKFVERLTFAPQSQFKQNLALGHSTYLAYSLH